jgi:predicted exporter
VLEKRLLADDPTGETLQVLQRLTPAKPPRRIQGVWFNAGGDGALLIAETRAAGSDLRGQEHAVATLRRIFDEVRDKSPAQLRYSSPGAMAVESRALIAADSTRLSLLSTLLVVILLVWFYRSLPVVVLCTLPAATGLLIGIAVVNFWFGSVHAITLGFGVTLLGEAVDYPSYLLTQVERDESPGKTLKRILPTLRLAVLTTACGSLALLMASFRGLAQLGLMTVVGVVVAGVVTCLLPYWLPAGWSGVVATGARLAAAVQIPATSRSRQGIIVATLAALLALASQRLWWDDDLANMNPLPDGVQGAGSTLRTALGRFRCALARWWWSARARNSVLRTGEQLRGHLAQVGRRTGTSAVSSWRAIICRVPATQSATASPLCRRPINCARISPKRLAGLPFQPDTFAPFLRAVDEARPSAASDDGESRRHCVRIESRLAAPRRWWIMDHGRAIDRR